MNLSNPLLIDAINAYKKLYKTSPDVAVYAPGRVNLIGKLSFFIYIICFSSLSSLYFVLNKYDIIISFIYVINLYLINIPIYQ